MTEMYRLGKDILIWCMTIACRSNGLCSINLISISGEQIKTVCLNVMQRSIKKKRFILLYKKQYFEKY